MEFVKCRRVNAITGRSVRTARALHALLSGVTYEKGYFQKE